MLISGGDDQIWPSTQLANIAIKRLEKHRFEKPYVHLRYPDAGHSIQPPYIPTTTTTMRDPVNGAIYALGGQPEANYRAGVDSWNKKLDFLNAHL